MLGFRNNPSKGHLCNSLNFATEWCCKGVAISLFSGTQSGLFGCTKIFSYVVTCKKPPDNSQYNFKIEHLFNKMFISNVTKNLLGFQP